VPIYEYRCNKCRCEFEALVLSLKDSSEVSCTRCGSKDLTRLISRFTCHCAEESRLDEFDTGRKYGDEFYRDSRNIGLWAKKRAKELGADLGPKFDEVLERARTDPGKYIEDKAEGLE